jgi:hypothetical protein
MILQKRAKSQLRLFGASKKFEHVQMQYTKLLRHSARKYLSLELDYKKFCWACHRAFKLQLDSTPKRIVAAGSCGSILSRTGFYQWRKSHRTQRPIRWCMMVPYVGQVYWTEAENPARTGVGPVHCLDCFNDLCSSATIQGVAVKVRCVRSSGKLRVSYRWREQDADLPQLSGPCCTSCHTQHSNVKVL